MDTHAHPMRPVRALAPRRSSGPAGLLAVLALLFAACSDPASRISAPALFHNSGNDPSAAGSGFAVLANAAVTCTNGTITGDVGTFQAAPTGSVTLTICPIIGSVHVGDGAAIAAYNEFLNAYAALAPKLGDCDAAHTLPSTIPASRTLSPGVWCTDAALTATDVTLTLDGGGDANAVWIFKIGTSGTGALTGTGLSVVMAGGAQACNVTWWVAEAATVKDSHFSGSILAGSAITSTRGTLDGNAYAKADVTITGTAVTGCDAAGSPICRVSRDRVTGGGWIRGPSSAKATFGVSGGFNVKKNAFRGQLEFNDHGGNGPKVKGTGVTAYVVVDAVTRRIGGTARVNGVAGFTYEVVVSDNGEPGRNDGFAIRLWNAAGALVYTASGTLGGGNIELHVKRDGRGCRKDRDGKDGHDDDDDDDADHDDRHGN